MGVTAFRRLIHAHRALAALLLLAALSLKLLVPAGFMPVAGSDGTITVLICSGAQAGPMTMEMPVPGLPAGHGDPQTPAKAEMPCTFAGLAMPMLSGADPLLLAVAIAFVLALAVRAVLPVPPRPAVYLRPPLRGPPATA